MKRVLSVILAVCFCLSVLFLLTSCAKEGDLVKKVNGMTVSEAYKAAMEDFSTVKNILTDGVITINAKKDDEDIDIKIKMKQAMLDEKIYFSLNFDIDAENVDLSDAPVSNLGMSIWYVDGVMYMMSSVMNMKMTIPADKIDELLEEIDMGANTSESVTSAMEVIEDELSPELCFTKTADGYYAEITVDGKKITDVLQKTFGTSEGGTFAELFESDEIDFTFSDLVYKLYFDKKGNIVRFTYESTISGNGASATTIADFNILVDITEEQFPALPENASSFIDVTEYYKDDLD